MQTTPSTTPPNNWLSRLFARSYTINWEVILFIAIVLIAFFTRFYDLGSRAMSHDESLHTRYSYNLSEDGNFQHSPLMHGPILFHATALSYTLFGDNDFTSRIYTSLLGVALVMTPLLFRRWLGRWGTILATLMLLISPLIMYYGRYIRHDTPSILSAILMIWGTLMYISGPPDQRRRAHWLYLIAGAMIWNLGSKETAFIYVFIIGIFLALFWFARLIQHFGRMPGKPIYYIFMLGTFLGGVMSLGMYIVLDIIKFDMLSPTEITAFGALDPVLQANFYIWSAIVIGSVIVFTLLTVLWSYRKNLSAIPWGEVASMLLTALLVCSVLVVIEELSHTGETATSIAQPVSPADPDAEVAGVTGEALSWLPMFGVWGLALAGFAFLFATRRRDSDGDALTEKDKHGRGFWGTMDLFPEVDVMVVIATLILPWATAAIPHFMGRSAEAHAVIAEGLPQPLFNAIQTYVPKITTAAQIGDFWLHVLAFVPLMALSIGIGMMWNWRRWSTAALVFYAIFVFFFTTVFTNMAGLGTGMVESLGYWLDQQDVRRGSQPQYYYLLIIMPFYEFLPVIGSLFAMGAGLTVFWNWRKDDNGARIELQRRERFALLADAADDESPSLADDETPRDPDEPMPVAKGRFAGMSADQLMALRERAYLTDMSFLIFFSWLAVLNLVGYSLAGEKMPWLGTHLTMPLIFLSGWFFGGFIDRLDFERFKERGWQALLLLSFLFVALFQAIRPLLMGTRPFSGLSQDALAVTYSWIAAVIISGAGVAGLVYLAERVSWKQVSRLAMVVLFGFLSLITLRSAVLASFVNYDYATEFLVYAHAAPGVKWVLEDIEELSLRVTDGYDLRVAYDNEVSWPYSWYFRNFDNVIYVGENPTLQNLDDAVVVLVGSANRSKVEPILEDRYIRYDHIRLWWPMQDYFGLTASRVQNLLDPVSPDAALYRQGIFEIWWDRDYTTYGLASGGDFSVTNWPVSDRMHFYVRGDIAAQIWPYSVGDGSAAVFSTNDAEPNLCTVNWQETQAVAALQAPGGMINPLDVTVDSDGTVYVAEEFGHTISRFNPDGTFLDRIGSEGNALTMDSVQLTRPNGLAFTPDGHLVIADTWNFRIQVLDESLNPLTVWGQAGTFGFDAPTDPVDGLWGPRDVAVDDQGRVYVSDTGNKRVRVYQLTDGVAQHLFDIGEGGSGLGQLDEPSGLALHPDGRVFVADTWNRRVSVFDNNGVFLETFAVRGWYEEQGNRPYLAVDPARELLYVTDPDAGRVLVYTTAGDCVGSFGQAAGPEASLGQFQVASGIAVDADGFVYVADSRLGRVLKFPPFEYTPTAPREDGAQQPDVVPVDNADEGDAAE